MRTSLITRSVVAVASLAIGSAALAAVPATAATPSGITRDMVLTAAASVRAAPPGSFNEYGAAGNRALKAMANRACSIDPDGPESYFGAIAGATAPGGAADGVVVTAVLGDSLLSGPESPTRICTFGAVATTAAGSVLSGTATINGAPSALPGDVFATPATRSELTGSPGMSTVFPAFAASGNAVQSITVKIKDKKTAKQKKAAKKTYAKRLASVKKVYKKALAKAGSSRSKKAAATKTYKAKVKSAKATYRYRIANYKLRTVKVATPFNVSAQATPPD